LVSAEATGDPPPTGSAVTQRPGSGFFDELSCTVPLILPRLPAALAVGTNHPKRSTEATRTGTIV
jgi:hypothetical protein